MPDWKSEIRKQLADAGLPPARESDIVEEIAQHLEDRYRELRASGIAGPEAYEAALAELDLPAATDAAHVRTAAHVRMTPRTSRRMWGGSLGQDLRYGLRVLRGNPGFTAVAVLTLALGIGANTAMFSIVNMALFRPIFAERPEEILAVFGGPTRENGSLSHTYPDYLDSLRESVDVVSGLSAVGTQPANVALGGGTERLNIGLVTDNYFDVLGVKPIVGRDFLPEENVTPGVHPVAIVSEGLWRRQLGAAASLASSTLLVNNHRYTVVGVVPERAARFATVVKIDVFVPAMMQGPIRNGRHYLYERNAAEFLVMGRRRPDATLARVQERFDRIAAQQLRAYPETWGGKDRPRLLTVMPELESRVRIAPRGMVFGFAALLMGVVGGVLLIACANLASVSLARGLGRRQELAVRVALGASRRRLVGQLLAETFLLAASGAVAGVLLALLVQALAARVRLPISLPIVIDLSLDHRVLAFTLFVSVLTTMAFGLAPALQVTSPALTSGLQEGQRTQAGSRRISRLRNLLLVAQVAVSLVLLVCAGLFLRSLATLQAIDPGFRPDGVAVLSVDLSAQGYEPARQEAFVLAAVARLDAVPGVDRVDVAQKLPMGFSRLKVPLLPEGQEAPAGELPLLGYNVVGPHYLEIMGMRLRRGRGFTVEDRAGAPPVAIVNDAVVRRYWPEQDPLGKTLRWEDGRTMTVIGVVDTAKYDSLTEPPLPFVYMPYAQNPRAALIFHVRARQAPGALLGSLRRELLAMDPALAVFDVKTLNEHLALSLLPMRFGGWVLGAFGALALGLAAVGLYGVMAYVVSQRTSEIGIRMALGAQRRDVTRLVQRQGLRLVAWGMALGLIPSAILSGVAASELYGLTPTDVGVLVAVVVLQGFAAWLACWLPARRAVRLDPVAALRRG